MLITADLIDHDSNSKKKPTFNFLGNPPTHTRGMGMARVEETQPVPLPQCTLPTTHAGFKTLDNH